MARPKRMLRLPIIRTSDRSDSVASARRTFWRSQGTVRAANWNPRRMAKPNAIREETVMEGVRAFGDGCQSRMALTDPREPERSLFSSVFLGETAEAQRTQRVGLLRTATMQPLLLAQRANATVCTRYSSEPHITWSIEPGPTGPVSTRRPPHP